MSKTMTTLDAISDIERNQINDAARNVGTIFLKTMLNRLDSKAFPLKAGSDRLAADVAVLTRHLSPNAFNILRPRLEKIRADASKTNAVLRAPVKTLQKISISEKKLPKNEDTVLRAGNYKSVQLLLRALHCINETNPENGVDTMILGGVLIGATGNLNVINSRHCGFFETDDRIEYAPHTQHLGLFSLNTTPTYPKYFYAVFKLIESDAIDIEAEVTGLTELMSVLGQIARSITPNFNNPLIQPVYAAYLFLILRAVIYTSFDEEDFPPIGVDIFVTASSETQSGNLVTDNISGLGGTYRIGYKWKLLK